MTSAKVNISALYSELSRAGENGEFDKALKIANKILQEVEDGKVIHCKAVCLIHLSQFEDALKLLSDRTSECSFEKAYCLYRLNKIQEAWDTVKDVTNPSWKVKELSAQVLYRLERYEESFEAYRELIKNSDDDYEEERETNMAAVVANLCTEKVGDIKKPHLREHTYELCYNSACILLAQNEYDKSIEKLKAAEELCKKTLEENDVPQEEIEAELGIIRVQMGYALQMKNKVDLALNAYNQVLKKKPTDSAVIAVASNNIITINKDQNIFDSKKKIKVVITENLDSKLTSRQLQSIAVNHCLLLLHTNQMEQCRRQVLLLAKRFPSSSADIALLQAALHCKEKKVEKAVDVLKEYATNHPDQSDTLSFTLAQLLLTQGHVSQACETLQSMGELSYTPGVLSALVTLFLSLEDKEAALNVLTDAVTWYKKTLPHSPAVNIIIREAAKMELKNGHPKEASVLLEEVRRTNPNDLKTLAQLISAYSQFDAKKAKDVSSELPSLTDKMLNIDIDSLESTSWTMGAKYIKKGGRSDPPSSQKATNGDILIKKKKKHRKKGKLPKNYDPNVDPDPERWLPKRERSTFKKKKDKRGTAIGKGTQGAIATNEESSKPSNVPSPAAAPAQSSPNVQGPRHQKANQKKRRKGGRW